VNNELVKSDSEQVKLEIDWEKFLGPNDMEWVTKPVSWDEGAFIGNGQVGAMIYGEENAKKRHVLRFVTGRTDITATRTDQSGFSPRVPIGELHLEMAGMIYHPTQLRLDLWNAEVRGHLTTTKGEVKLRTFVHSKQPVMTVEIEASSGELGSGLQWYVHPEVDPVLINADGINLNQFIPVVHHERTVRNGITISIQSYRMNEGCVTALKEVKLSETKLICYLSVAKGCDENAIQEAVEAVERASATSMDEWVNTHRAWWHNYYKQSFVSIPDGQFESFYWIQMYKLASATRSDKPIIDNQGPWLAPTPWAGVWFNMNVQMSYSPVYTANRLDIGESLVRSLAENQMQLIRNVPLPYQHDSAGLGRSCSYDLDSPVDNEVGNLAWVCHNLWRHYRYSMDDDLLRDTLYPILRRSINYYIHLLEEGEDGCLHLPPTISPEYGSFMKTLVRDCHYDLALLRWGCETLLASCERLQQEDSLQESWRHVLARLTPLPIDDTGFMVGQDTPLAYGHRHFSHLLAVYPLHLIDGDREKDRQLIEKSLRHWIQKEGDLRGFSLSGAASIAATLGKGSEALRYLKALMHVVKPNTMYKEAGPVMETPLGGAEAIQDMLLQSWGGKLRVFPAVPEEWSEATFHGLRAEGAFLVSAVRAAGETSWIRVKSLEGEPCFIQTSWSGTVRWKISGSDRAYRCELSEEQSTISIALAKGEEVILYQSDEMPELRIQSVKVSDRPIRPFGGNKPWRLYGFSGRRV
jgi:alpha-L-fucosidase 2